MANIPKDPLDWMTLFQQQMDDLIDFISEEGGTDYGECDFVPPVDIFETADDFTVEIELPGFEKGDLTLRLCCNMLVIEGSKREECRDRGVSYICLERQFGRFCRTIEIPPTVDTGKVKAVYRKGILSVEFPRLSDKRKIIRDIPIEQGDENGD